MNALSTGPAYGEWPYGPQLSGRRVIVLGAGTRPSADADAPVGNGRAISIGAAQAGATVACVDVREEAARGTARTVEGYGGTAIALTADLRSPDAPAKVLDQAAETLGGIDGIVVNVGIGAGFGLARTSVEQWDETLEVNLRAHFLTAKAALGILPRGGSLVFISSTAAVAAGSFFPAYDASKAGLTGLLRQVAWEGSPLGIRANAVAPGVIDTPLGRFAFDAHGTAPNEVPLPLGRPGTAAEVAATVIFLLSTQSSYITGETIMVDGGLTSVPSASPIQTSSIP
ncbi:SDR family NAD(P)-dependent oxidoreductase [Nocardia flavorosea]|uniref:SDR family oxidoreductase n=1 Tax=Nocardia flavorosea TaxID=53429 RepID=A0A846YLF4_9NOCA|nr:SDR family oxidoreductase [Nocardia flavorosea]NKY58332.1 SDR family oxidoreductase [Nocardia flavorosea]